MNIGMARGLREAQRRPAGRPGEASRDFIVEIDRLWNCDELAGIFESRQERAHRLAGNGRLAARVALHLHVDPPRKARRCGSYRPRRRGPSAYRTNQVIGKSEDNVTPSVPRTMLTRTGRIRWLNCAPWAISSPPVAPPALGAPRRTSTFRYQRSVRPSRRWARISA